jgi:actin-related protein
MALVIAEQEVPPIILETDDTHVKAGFAEEDVPRTISAAVAGNYYPVDRGFIKQITHAELIWEDVFNYKLNADPAKHGVMFTEPILNPVANAKKIGTSMFEHFSAPYIATAPGPVMALYASGRSTGISMSVGGGVSQCIPIVDGYPVLQARGEMIAQASIPFGGKDVTRFLGRTLMPHRGAWLHSLAEQEIVANVLETVCFVPDTPLQFNEFEHDPVETQAKYTMPDGMELEIGMERFKAGESMFRPELGLLPTVATIENGSQTQKQLSMSTLIWDTVSKVEEGIQADLFNNVVLSGSLTLTKGFDRRLLWELTELSGNTPVRVIAKTERKYLEWMGASITATLSSFAQNWILASEYEEVGPSVMERKGMFTDLRRDELDEVKDWEKDPIVAQPKALEVADETIVRNATMENMSLWRAAIEGETQTLTKALLTEKVEINAGDPNNEGMTALHFASRYGNSEIVETLLQNPDLDVNNQDDFGKTALHWAAGNEKSIQAVSKLVENGININGKDRLGRTALHYAAQQGNDEIVSLLIKAGADAAATDRTFRTPVDWASTDAVRGAFSQSDVSTA